MNPRAQLEEYRRQMGADRARRQMALDNRTADGVCVTCGAGLGREHDPRCAFAAERERERHLLDAPNVRTIRS